MPNQPVNPPGTPANQAYSPGVVAPAGRILHVSGQIATAGPDGKIPTDPAEQCRMAWDGVRAVIAAAGMTLDDLVKITVFLTSAEHVPVFRTSRAAALEGRKPASTLLIVAGLADPAWLVEIEAVAIAQG